MAVVWRWLEIRTVVWSRLQPPSRFILIAFLSIGVGFAARTPFVPSVQADPGEDRTVWLTVLRSPVEVQRVGTSEWAAVQRETLISAGDQIRTGPNGAARLVFRVESLDSDRLSTDIASASQVRLDGWAVAPNAYSYSISVITGQALQRLAQPSGAAIAYTAQTPGLTFSAQNALVSMRVEADGRSSLLVFRGSVNAQNISAAAPSAAASPGFKAKAVVSAGFGIRAEASGDLSDSVPVSNFVALDAALDGCAARIDLSGDIRINVRLGPDLHFPRIGSIENHLDLRVLGVTRQPDWYRIPFKGGAGWIFAFAGLRVLRPCPFLVPYPASWPGEDATRYVGLDPDVTLTPTPTLTETVPTPMATAITTATPGKGRP